MQHNTASTQANVEPTLSLNFMTFGNRNAIRKQVFSSENGNHPSLVLPRQTPLANKTLPKEPPPPTPPPQNTYLKLFPQITKTDVNF